MNYDMLMMSVIIAFLGLFLGYMILDDEKKKMIFHRKAKASDDKGDANLLKTVKRFAAMKNYDVLPKTTIEYNGIQFTFDAILLGFYGTIAINSVNLSGEIYGQANDEKWVQVLEGKRAEFANPIKEMNGSIRFFKDMYKAEKVKFGNADSEVVFTSKKVELYAGKNSTATTIAKLYSKLDAQKYLTDNGADMQAMKTVIEKYTVK